MKYDPRSHHRRSIRLKGYDYAQAGAFFVTLCTVGRECLFGEVAGGVVRLNPVGECVRKEWERSSVIRAEIEFDEWVVMPNHIHGIVVIVEIDNVTSLAEATGDPSALAGVTGETSTPVGATGDPSALVGATGDPSALAGATGDPSALVGATDDPSALVGATGRSPLRNARGPSKRSLGSFIGGFKSAATTQINQLRGQPGHPVWQRNYYEHIVRNSRELNAIRRYIRNNPIKWSLDRDNLQNMRTLPAPTAIDDYLADFEE